MSDNRRTSTRHTVSIPTQVTVDGNAREVTMVNISLGGALIEMGTKHAMGQRMTIQFRVPSVDHTIEVGATVRWADAKGVGLQFDGLRASDVWALNAYFKHLGS